MTAAFSAAAKQPRSRVRIAGEPIYSGDGLQVDVAKRNELARQKAAGELKQGNEKHDKLRSTRRAMLLLQ